MRDNTPPQPAHALRVSSVFVFLLVTSSLVLATIVVFLPETLRTIAGNGSLRLSGIHQPLIRRFVKEKHPLEEPDYMGPRPKVTLATFLRPLALLGQKDILVSLVFGGTVYTVWSMVVASTTGLFKDLFQLNDLLLGLVFLPNGTFPPLRHSNLDFCPSSSRRVFLDRRHGAGFDTNT